MTSSIDQLSSALSNATERYAAAAKPVVMARPADKTAAALFDDVLAQSGQAAGEPEGTAAKAALPDITISLDRKGSQSGKLSPTQQFESFVLRNFVESMLPSKNTEYFGEGTAGEIWKSMLAERIGDEMTRAGGIGIADMLEHKATKSASLDKAKDALVKANAMTTGAEATLRRGG